MVSTSQPGKVLAVIVALLLVAELLAVAITRDVAPPLRWYDAATELRAEMMADRGQADVVFAGTSMAWQGLVPSVFTATDPERRSAFNVGLNGAVPAVTGPWLTSTVVPVLDPEVVLWGLSSLDFAPAYGQEQVAAWTTSLQGRPGPLGVAERVASSVSTLVARRSQLRTPAALAAGGRADLAADRAEAAATTGPDGERREFSPGRSAQVAAVQRARLAGFEPDVTDVRAVVQTVLDLRDRGVEVVLAELPVPPSFAELHPGGSADLARAEEAIAALAAELGVPHLPVRRGYTDADFVDFTHLTEQAAARFTADVTTAMNRYTRATGPERDPGAGDDGSVPLATWVGDVHADAVLRPVRLAAITQVGCDGQALPAPAVTAARDAVAALADPTARSHLDGLLDAAEELARSCGTEARWQQAMAGLLAAAEPAVRHLEGAVPALGHATPEGVVAAALAQASSRDLAVYAQHAYDRLNWLLEGAANPRLSRNEVWWSYGERGLTAQLDADSAQGLTADTVVLGSSQARTGIDADLLSSLTGDRVVNAALDGGTVDLMRRWAPFVLDRTTPRRVVVVVSGVDFLTVVGPPCPTGSLDGFVRAQAIARRAFVGVPWLDGADPLSIVADPAPGAPLPSPLVPAFAPDESQDHPVLTEEEITARGRPYLASFEQFTPCEERLGTLGDLVGDLADAGIQPVVVTHPVRSALRAIAPPGALAQLDQRITQVATAAGAQVLTYTDLLPDSQMADVVHVTAEGESTLTTRLAADLGGGG